MKCLEAVFWFVLMGAVVAAMYYIVKDEHARVVVPMRIQTVSELDAAQASGLECRVIEGEWQCL